MADYRLGGVPGSVLGVGGRQQPTTMKTVGKMVCGETATAHQGQRYGPRALDGQGLQEHLRKAGQWAEPLLEDAWTQEASGSWARWTQGRNALGLAQALAEMLVLAHSAWPLVLAPSCTGKRDTSLQKLPAPKHS